LASVNDRLSTGVPFNYNIHAVITTVVEFMFPLEKRLAIFLIYIS